MSGKLSGKRVAMLVADGFEQIELTSPKKALESEGAKVSVVSPQQGTVKGWNSTKWGSKLKVDLPLENSKSDDFDALVLPGGVMNPDKLRRNEWALQFVKAFFDEGKPVAAICHGPWTLIDAGVVSGRKLTSYPSIQTDLINAGAMWVDEEVVVDGTLITSRKPDDLPAFNAKITEVISEASASSKEEMSAMSADAKVEQSVAT